MTITDNDEAFLRRLFAVHDPAAEPSDAGRAGAGDRNTASSLEANVEHQDASHGTASPISPHESRRDRAATNNDSSGRFRWRAPLIAAAVVAIVAAGASALATQGFGAFSSTPASPAPTTSSSDQQPRADISPDGRVAYACTLALHADSYGPIDVGTWNIAVGDQAGEPWRELVAIPGLLDVKVGASPRNHPGLRGPATDIERGVLRLDTDLAQSGLNDLVSWCQNHPDLRSTLGAGPEGRVAYACALALNADSYGPIDVDTWKIALGNQAGTPWRDLVAIPDLLGASVGAPPKGYEDLAGMMSAVPQQINQTQWDAVQTELDDFVAYCTK